MNQQNEEEENSGVESKNVGRESKVSKKIGDGNNRSYESYSDDKEVKKQENTRNSSPVKGQGKSG